MTGTSEQSGPDRSGRATGAVGIGVDGIDAGEIGTAEIAGGANAVGLVTARELASGTVAVRRGGSRRALWSVAVAGRVVGYLTRPSERERRLLGIVSGRDLAPRLLGPVRPGRRSSADGGDAGARADLVWSAAAPGTAVSASALRTSDPAARVDAACFWAELAQAAGVALARLHATAIGPEVGSAPRPWAVQRPTRPALADTPASRSLQLTVLRVAGSDPGLVQAARQAQDRWTDRCLVHGDPAARHQLVEHGADLRVRFVDFDRAGIGDPDWDVAGAAESLIETAQLSGVSEAVVSDYFLRGYRRGGGPGRFDLRLRGLWCLEQAWRLAASADGHGAAADSFATDHDLPGRRRVQWLLERARVLADGGPHLVRAA